MTKNVTNDTNCVLFETSKVQPSDINEILSIANICFADAWSHELFMSEINSENSICLKIKKEQVIIGYIIGRYFTDELHLMHLAVLPAYRRVGTARFLVNYLMENYDAEVYLLEVRTTNTAAINLYSGLGFKIIGKRKNYYSNGDDAIVMSRGRKKDERHKL